MKIQGSKTEFHKSSPQIRCQSNIDYIAFFDGCSKGNPGPAGIGYQVVSSRGSVVFQNCLNVGMRTNNEAEFLALVFCLLDCMHNNIKNLSVFGDSQLVVKGVTGEYNISE